MNEDPYHAHLSTPGMWAPKSQPHFIDTDTSTVKIRIHLVVWAKLLCKVINISLPLRQFDEERRFKHHDVTFDGGKCTVSGAFAQSKHGKDIDFHLSVTAVFD
jgi:hypothetical protein